MAREVEGRIIEHPMPADDVLVGTHLKSIGRRLEAAGNMLRLVADGTIREDRVEEELRLRYKDAFDAAQDLTDILADLERVGLAGDA